MSYPTASEFVPPHASLEALQEAGGRCRGCDLYLRATQTVFDEGGPDAQLMLVGEQPGDEEDRAGVPFARPSGRPLDASLERAGIDRRGVYVTNAVKHFKWEAKGARRLHKKPSAREARACLPWLSAEIEAVNPEVIVCLGATAAQSLLGASARVMQMRGKFVSGPSSASILVTVDPAAILRLRDADERKAEEGRFVADLRRVSRRLEARSSG